MPKIKIVILMAKYPNKSSKSATIQSRIAKTTALSDKNCQNEFTLIVAHPALDERLH
jgi:hypothetical protein